MPLILTTEQRTELEHLERWPRVYVERPPTRALEQLLGAGLVEVIRAPVHRSAPAWTARRREPDDRFRVTERGRAALAAACGPGDASLGGLESW